MLVLTPTTKILEITPKDFNVAQINRIKEENDAERSLSKPVTFAAQYQGTPYTFVNNSGFSIEEATKIYENYHALYWVSKEWQDKQIQQASIDGYATLAFGLRLRTPILAKTILGNSKTPYEAQAEARTLGNAISGQSHGMLNNRAAAEFQKRTLESPHKYDIKPFAMIHDAIYALVRDDVDVIEWFNKNLVECMQWQDLPELKHPSVKLGGAVDVFFPDWSHKATIPNGATQEEMRNIVCDKLDKYNS